MWAPVDITAVPTAGDLIDAKRAIEAVENELQNAYIALAQCQTRITMIEKDLQERRAWIAPIRRLSFDTITLIFDFCGEDNWKTPLRISGVSREWRNMVLATPRAWAFLPVDQCEDETIAHFIQHSGQQPLHIRLGAAQSQGFLHEVTERLICLSVYSNHNLEGDVVFLRLKRLSIHGGDAPIRLSQLQHTQFPSLRELTCHSNIEHDVNIASRSIKLAFPPLQMLSVITSQHTTWIDLLTGCFNSLVSLRLHFVDNYPASKHRVTLPVLKCLEICTWLGESNRWPMELKTPLLETYIEGSEFGLQPLYATPIHGDVGNITQMRMDRAPNLSTTPLLVTLQIVVGLDVPDILYQLKSDHSLVPRLELVEARYTSVPTQYEEEIMLVNEKRSRAIQIKNTDSPLTPLPYAIVESPCGPDMPCSEVRGYFDTF